MTLSTETIDAYRTLMTNPKENGLSIKPLSEVFEHTDEPTAKHLLYEQYLTKIGLTENHLPKVIFYIVMDGLYEQKKAADKNLGYCVRIVND